jgi:hypothetical protein
MVINIALQGETRAIKNDQGSQTALKLKVRYSGADDPCNLRQNIMLTSVVIKLRVDVPQKAWETATAPGKSLFMYGFMLWMLPNSASLIPLSVCIVMMWNPLQSMLSVGSSTCSVWRSATLPFLAQADRSSVASRFSLCVVFAPYADDKTSAKLLLYKLVFLLLNGVVVGLAFWKLNKFGLLPLTEADWIGSYHVRTATHHAVGGFPL